MTKNDFILDKINKIRQSSANEFNIMEVCGTHTSAIARFGIRELIGPNIHLLSGPGCPVCVTSEDYIDAAIELLQYPNVIVATFGDMMKVKGSHENLICQRETGKNIKVLYSPLDSLTLARENKEKEIIFLSVGFETTTPLIALAIKTAQEQELTNISFLLGMKRMEPILHHILSDKNHNIQAMICPGHVAAVKGANYFKFIVEQYNIPAVITGFEELDIIRAIYFLVQQQEKPQPQPQQQGETKKGFQNLYKSCVTDQGNKRANELMEELFTYCEGQWRGIGMIRESQYALRKKYEKYDARSKFGIKLQQREVKTCVCGEILLGKKLPNNCVFFGKSCTPNSPIGPCMVSAEGTCAIFYKYKRSGIDESSN